jgi:hypothetical protein
MGFFIFLLRRASRHWQVLTTLVLGVVLATGLLASGPLLVNTVMDLALPARLRGAIEPITGLPGSPSILTSNLRLTTYQKYDWPSFQRLDRQIREQVYTRLKNTLTSVTGTAASTWVFPWFTAQDEPLRIAPDERLNLRYYEGIENHLDIISGSWPTRSYYLNSNQAIVIPALIGEALAEEFNLQTGDQLPVSFNLSDQQPSFYVAINGIARPQNPRDGYWFGEFNPLLPQSDSRWVAQYSVILPPEVFFIICREIFPAANLELNWNLLLAPEQVHAQEVPELLTQVRLLRQDLTGFAQRINLTTNLEGLLERFSIQSDTVRPPLYLLVTEVLFLALYYLVMVAALSLQQVEGEFATLSSRGASPWLLFKIQAFEAGLIGILALLIGPGIASFLVWLSGRIGPLAGLNLPSGDAVMMAAPLTTSVGGLGQVISRLPGSSWLAAAVGVLACFSGLLLPVIPALKRSVVAHQRNLARTKRVPWWQRYYLDVFILLVGLVATWRLRFYGGLSSGGTPGKVDWLLLFSPLALLIGSATILLRIFPLMLHGLAGITSRGRSLPAALAMWQTSRNPGHVVRLVLLLNLAMALGILSSGLDASLKTSATERARYASGSDVRLSLDRYISINEVVKDTGVTAGTTVWRGTGSINARSYRNFPAFTLLAIEPYSFAPVSSYRSDFSDEPIGVALGHLVTDPQKYPVSMLPVTGQPDQVGVWIKEDRQFLDQATQKLLKGSNQSYIERLSIKVKLQTAKGEMLTLNLVPVQERFENLSGEQLSEPLALTSGNPVFLPLVSNRNSLVRRAPEPTWMYYQSTLPPLPADNYPINLHSFWLQMRPAGKSEPSLRQYPFVMDDLSIYPGSSGENQVVDSFEDPLSIWQANDATALVRSTRGPEAHTGESSLSVWIPGDQDPHGTSISPVRSLNRAPLPALASQTFVDATQVNVGDVVVGQVSGTRLFFKIVGLLNYFPTLYDTPGRGFLVTTRDPLLTLLNRDTPRAVNSNEIWVRTTSSSAAAKLAAAFPSATQTWLSEEERRAILADPLFLGLQAITYLGFGLTALLSLVGFATYFYLNARQRQSFYGILRSLGLSPFQLYGSLVIEQVVLIISGLALGILLGYLLNRFVLPGLPITLGNSMPIPPFVPHDDWLSIRKLIFLLIAAFMLILGSGTFLLWRAQIHRVLRIGEE